jgi:hypothetical protein
MVTGSADSCILTPQRLQQPLIGPKLTAAIIARGDPTAAAEIQAAKGAVPARLEAQASTPYDLTAASSSSSSSSSSKGAAKRQAAAARKSAAGIAAAAEGCSAEQAAEQLRQQLLQPSGQLPYSAIMRQLCAAGSPSSLSLQGVQRYDPQLVDSMYSLLCSLYGGKDADVAKQVHHAWFAAAFLLVRLQDKAEASGFSFADLVGPGAVDTKYLRYAAKHVLFADTGWLSVSCVVAWFESRLDKSVRQVCIEPLCFRDNAHTRHGSQNVA